MVRRIRGSIVVLVFASLLSFGMVSPANARVDASPNDGSDVMQSTYQVINRRLISSTYQSSYIGWGCSASIGSTCQVSVTGTYTRTAQGGVGATAAWASANLGISYARSVSFSTTCTSPKVTSTTVGKVYRARLVGSRYSYQIQRTDWIGGMVVGRATSGTLYAFQPTSFRCGWYSS